MGQAQIIPSTRVLTGFDYGSLVDRRITRGTLGLWDAAHSQGGFGAGVPVTNQILPNLALNEAAAIIGSGTSSTLGLTVFNTMIGQDGGMERTPKGGLHVAPARSGTSNQNFYRLDLPLLLRTFARTNPAHSYYTALVGRLTRGRVDGSAVAMSPLIFSNNNNRIIILDEPGVVGADLGFSQTATPLVTAQSSFLMDGAAAGWDGTVPSSDTGMIFDAGYWGAGSAWGSAAWGKGASWVFYSYTIEDLTISGRTYAQAHAKNLAQYTADFGTGGRYTGDTFTAPATLAGS